MFGQGIKNVADHAGKAANHVRSRVDGMSFKPKFIQPKYKGDEEDE